jgi:hypothetical protein
MRKKKEERAKPAKENAKVLGIAAATKNEAPKPDHDDLFGFMQGRFEIVGDIGPPIEDWLYWSPEKN